MAPRRYPEIRVRLVGADGKAFSILGGVNRALRDAGVDPVEIGEFEKEATSGDYDRLLETVCKWVSVS